MASLLELFELVVAKGTDSRDSRDSSDSSDSPLSKAMAAMAKAKMGSAKGEPSEPSEPSLEPLWSLQPWEKPDGRPATFADLTAWLPMLSPAACNLALGVGGLEYWNRLEQVGTGWDLLTTRHPVSQSSQTLMDIATRK